MCALNVDYELLKKFEAGFDPQHPERGDIPYQVIGYGEISAVLDIAGGGSGKLAYKRVPIFQSEQEVVRYEALYEDYLQAMQNQIGIEVVHSELVRVTDDRRNRVVVYIVQEKLAAKSIGNNAIHHLQPGDVRRLVSVVLEELAKLFEFNQKNKGRLELGIDGQISNWAFANFDPDANRLGEKVDLIYFDTSSPLMRKNGAEQLDPELFLRSAPSFMVWILRKFFLQDVMTRYYDFRKVSIDLIANFYKEGRSELIPDLVHTANDFFSTRYQSGGIKPLGVEEVKAYYREDAMIWRLYLAFRKLDRSLHNLSGKYYPYILPPKIKR